MTQIGNNNIELISPTGKKYYVCMHWLKIWIPLIKRELATIETDFRRTLAYKVIGFGDNVVFLKNRTPHMLIKESVLSTQLFTKEYYERLEESLQDGKVITIRDWKFRVI